MLTIVAAAFGAIVGGVIAATTGAVSLTTGVIVGAVACAMSELIAKLRK